MSFRNHCPSEYQPAGFRSSETHSISTTDWNNLWETPSSTTTSFETSHHAVRIAARNKEYEAQSTSQLEDTLMSRQIHNLQRTSSNRNGGLQSTIPAPSTPPHNAKRISEDYMEEGAPGSPKFGLTSWDDQSLTEAVKKIETKQCARRRKISISGKFVAVGRSSPASGMTLDDEAALDASRQSNHPDLSDDSFR